MSYKGDKIKTLAGHLSTADIAELMGLTKKAVESIAYKERISLATHVKKDKLKNDELWLSDKLERASMLLRQNGYKVFLPCPFRDYVDER